MFNPDKKMYRQEGVKKQVEKTSEELYGNPELYAPEKMKGMFGLPDGVELSEKEVERFRRYSVHAGKRMLVAAIDREHMGDLKSLPIHDVAHTFGAYTESEGVKNAFVPEFLKKNYEGKDINGMKEECFALMWWNPLDAYPIFISLMDAEKAISLVDDFKWKLQNAAAPYGERFIKEVEDAVGAVDPHNFESVLEAYYKVVLLALKSRDTGQYVTDKLSAEEIKEHHHAFSERAAEVMANKEERTIALARDIYEGYEKDPKILYHKFEEICGPVLERLKRKSSREAA